MKVRTQLCSALLVVQVLATGCQTMSYHTNPDAGIYSGVPNAKSVGTFEEKRTAHYMFWGLAPVSTPSLEEVVAGRLAPDKALSNITISEKNTFVDGLLAIVTLGIYRPRTLVISGNIYEREDLTHVN